MAQKKAETAKAETAKAETAKAETAKAETAKAETETPTLEALETVRKLIADNGLQDAKTPTDCKPVVLPYAIWDAVEQYDGNPRTWRNEKESKAQAKAYDTYGWMPATDQGIERLPQIGFEFDETGALRLLLINGYGRCTPFRDGSLSRERYDFIMPTVRLFPLAIETELRARGLSLVDDFDQQKRYTTAQQWQRYCEVVDIAIRQKETDPSITSEVVRERGSLAIGKRNQNANWYTCYLAYHADRQARKWSKPIVSAWHDGKITMAQFKALAEHKTKKARLKAFDELFQDADPETVDVKKARESAVAALKDDELTTADLDALGAIATVWSELPTDCINAVITIIDGFEIATGEQRKALYAALKDWKVQE